MDRQESKYYREALKDMWLQAVAWGHNHAKWLIEQEESRLTDLERNPIEKEETT